MTQTSDPNLAAALISEGLATLKQVTPHPDDPRHMIFTLEDNDAEAFLEAYKLGAANVNVKKYARERKRLIGLIKGARKPS
jgi:hypothetical protein